MAGEVQAERWLRQLAIEGKVELLPLQSRAQMAEIFRRAWVVVSPSVHDGTPNTLLEAMACGCFPVVGDIESLREWIQPGVNGLLVDPRDPKALAEAVLSGLGQTELLVGAAQKNVRPHPGASGIWPRDVGGREILFGFINSGKDLERVRFVRPG